MFFAQGTDVFSQKCKLTGSPAQEVNMRQCYKWLMGIIWRSAEWNLIVSGKAIILLMKRHVPLPYTLSSFSYLGKGYNTWRCSSHLGTMRMKVYAKDIEQAHRGSLVFR